MKPLPETTTQQNDRYIAGGLNLASIPMPYVGPIVGLVLGSRSPFVRYHALRAIIEQMVLTTVTVILVVASLAWSIYSLMQTGIDLQKIDWVVVIGKSVALYLILAVMGLLNTINSIRDAVDALSGNAPKPRKWTERLAARWSGLNPR